MGELNRNFYFARHGQTDWNVREVCQGQIDIPLNAKGRQEAHLLGQKCQNLPITTLFTSPLSRAYETAEIVATYLPGVKLVIVDELKERSWGLLEGIGSQLMYQAEENEGSSSCIMQQNKVESKEELKLRIIKALNICHMHAPSPQEEILLISHGRFYLILCELLNLTSNKQILNTELINICYDSNLIK